MEICVNEYVRTNRGFIDKVDRYSIGCSTYHCKNGMCIDVCNISGTHLEDIVKHSKNIIDLIEEGDYVNGHRVKAVYLDGVTKYIKLDNSYEDRKGVRTYSEDIKSIVTKQQFSNIEYKVVE